MTFPDRETLRRMEEMRRLMPSREEQLMIDEFRRAARDPIREAVIRQHLQFKQQYGDQIAVIASELASNPMMDMVKAVAGSMAQFQATNSQVIRDAAAAIGHVYKNIPSELLTTLRSTLTQFDNGPAWAAFETMRQLGFEDVSQDFSEFAERTVTTPGKLEKKQIKKLTKAYVAKKKKSGLTKEQYRRLTLAIAILSLIVTFYGAIKNGQPPPTQIFNFNEQGEVQKEIRYKVIRPCQLKAKPNFKSATLATLRKNQIVELVFRNHQWIYVEYTGHGIHKAGWTNKKYLEKQD